MSRMGGGPDDPGEADAAAEGLDRGDDAVEVERNVEEDREGGKEGTTTSFTKDSTADESLSNYDNFSNMDFSFERSRVASRDANSAILLRVSCKSAIMLLLFLLVELLYHAQCRLAKQVDHEILENLVPQCL